MRSPEAVLEWAAYHDAPPQPVAANAAMGLITTQADIVAVIARVREIIFKTDLPSTLLSAAGEGDKGLNPVKNGEKVPQAITDCYSL